MSEHAVATVEPAIGTPRERVQRFVSVAISPAIEKDLRFAGGFGFVAIFDRNEHQVGSGTNPDTAEPNFKSADEIEAFHEDGAAIEFAVAICVLEDEDAIFALTFRSANGISVCFGDPETATIINCECNRLFHVRLACEQSCLETGRK